MRRISFADWLFARKERQVLWSWEPVWPPVIETVGVTGGAYRQATREVLYARLERYARLFIIEGWPMRRRLRCSARIGLLATAAMALFWGAWWLLAGSVPETASVPWTVDTAIALPFALSRLWDIPAMFVWAAGVALIGTYVPDILRESCRTEGNTKRESVFICLGLGLLHGLSVGVLCGGDMGPVSGLSIGLVISLCMGLGFAQGFGPGGILHFMLVVCLCFGLQAGLVLSLPSALPFMFAIIGLSELVLRSFTKSAAARTPAC